MQNYIFLSIFILIFAFSKRNRLASLVMIVAYMVYIFLINPVDNDRLYYLLTASLDFFVGFFMVALYLKTGYVNAKYIAYCSFISFFVHVYGRIVYDFEGDTSIYVMLCVLIVITKVSLMIIRPLNNGVFRHSNRSSFICFDGRINKELGTKVQAKKGFN